MTTIVFSHKENKIAVDSRVSSSGGFIFTDEEDKKKVMSNGDVLFLAGVDGDHELLYESWPAIPEGLECEGFMVSDGKAYDIVIEESGRLIKVLCRYDHARGSGSDFAITALDMGASADEAVKMAMKRDKSTGGKINVYDVGDL